MGDVLAHHTTGVEGTHGELGARLADGLCGDYADRLTELDQLARRERLAVAGSADTLLALARENRAHADPVDRRVHHEGVHFRVAEHEPGLEDAPA